MQDRSLRDSAWEYVYWNTAKLFHQNIFASIHEIAPKHGALHNDLYDSVWGALNEAIYYGLGGKVSDLCATKTSKKKN